MFAHPGDGFQHGRNVGKGGEDAGKPERGDQQAAQHRRMAQHLQLVADPTLHRRLGLTAGHQGNDCQGGKNANQRDHKEGVAPAKVLPYPGAEGTPRILAVAPRKTAETAEARLSTGASSAA